MKITKEQMLEWLKDKQYEADDLHNGKDFDMTVAIRALIESALDKSTRLDAGKQ